MVDRIYGPDAISAVSRPRPRPTLGSVGETSHLVLRILLLGVTVALYIVWLTSSHVGI